MTASSTEVITLDKTKTWSTNMMSFDKSSIAESNTTLEEIRSTTKSNEAVASTQETNIITKMIGGTKTSKKGLKFEVLYFCFHFVLNEEIITHVFNDF